MKIVFLASRFPYPPLQGDRARAYHQLKQLSRNHAVTLIAPYDRTADQQHLVEVERLCQRLELVPFSRAAAALRLVRALPGHAPLQSAYFADPALRQRLIRVIERDQPDVIHVQLVRLAQLAAGLTTTPTVLDLIDSLALNMLRRARREQGLRQLLFYNEAQRLIHAERAACRTYDRQVISSAFDRMMIGQHATLRVVPNGVDLDSFTFRAPAVRPLAPPTIVFTGKMSYFPNDDAARAFIEGILPQIRTHYPDVRVRIVGADPAPALISYAEAQGVEVTGRVASVAAELQQATIAVAPMRSGSGGQFKVLEAMATGTPVVATGYAIGGVDVEHGVHLLRADQPDAFARAAIELLADVALRQRLAQRAHQLIQRYSWQHSVAQLEAVYREARQAERYSAEPGGLDR